MSIKHIAQTILIIFISVLTAFDLYSQNTDTIKVNITNQVYDTVRIYDTVIKIDTVWIEPILKEFSISPTYSIFFTNWSKLNNDLVSIISSQSYSIGIKTDFVFKNFSLSPGISFTQFNEDRKLKYSFTNIDSLLQTEIIPITYMEYDTTGVSWITESYDFTYFDTVLNENVTITITDTLMLYQIDSTSISYNDTIMNTVYDTITIDTTAIKKFNYKYLEVPLIINYKLLEYKKLRLFVGAGAIAGLLIKSESYFLNTETNSIIRQPEEENYRLLPSLWLSLEAEYQFNDRLSVSISPFYNPGLRSISKSGIGVYGIPNRYGVNLGFKWIF